MLKARLSLLFARLAAARSKGALPVDGLAVVTAEVGFSAPPAADVTVGVVAAGVTAALGTTLLVLAQRSARVKRWSAAPWWSPTGAGLMVRIQLGAAR